MNKEKSEKHHGEFNQYESKYERNIKNICHNRSKCMSGILCKIFYVIAIDKTLFEVSLVVNADLLVHAKGEERKLNRGELSIPRKCSNSCNSWSENSIIREHTSQPWTLPHFIFDKNGEQIG